MPSAAPPLAGARTIARVSRRMMQRTILKTPVVAPLVRGLSRAFLRLTGWRIDPMPPRDLPKYVLIAAPHTSNQDFFYAMAACWAADLNVYWMGKHTIFPFPIAGLMKWLGGIPVDRSHGHTAAKKALEAYRAHEEMIIIIPPEATRSKTDAWKRGFYVIARSAQVPIVCGFLDFGRKLAGFGPVIHPSRNVDADMEQMQEFYGGITAKHPELVSPVILPKR